MIEGVFVIILSYCMGWVIVGDDGFFVSELHISVCGIVICDVFCCEGVIMFDYGGRGRFVGCS